MVELKNEYSVGKVVREVVEDDDRWWSRLVGNTVRDVYISTGQGG
jgi:hypothetical protein